MTDPVWTARAPDSSTLGIYVSEERMLAALKRRMRPGEVFTAHSSRDEQAIFVVTPSGVLAKIEQGKTVA